MFWLCRNLKFGIKENATDSLKSSRTMLESVLVTDEKFSGFSGAVISRMTKDSLTNFVKNDKLLMLYGFTMYEAKFFLNIDCTKMVNLQKASTNMRTKRARMKKLKMVSFARAL